MANEYQPITQSLFGPIGTYSVREALRDAANREFFSNLRSGRASPMAPPLAPASSMPENVQRFTRRKRPEDFWTDSDIISEPSPVLDSYPTSWSDVGRDLSNIPGQLWKDISNIPESLGEMLGGASAEEKTTGLSGDGLDQNLFSEIKNFGRGTLSGSLYNALTDPKSSFGEKAGALAGMGVSAMMPFPLVAGLGLFGGLLNSMGAYHDYDKSKDTDLSFDLDSGELSWGGIGSNAGGGQYGSRNNMNMLQDISRRFPNEYISTPFGYTTAGNLKDAIGSGKFQDTDAYHGGTDYGQLGFTQDTPFGWQPFGQGDHNVTNQHALAQYLDSGIGAIQNEAGDVADRFGYRGSPGDDFTPMGYNQQQVLADAMAQTGAIAPEMANIYGGYDIPSADASESLSGPAHLSHNAPMDAGVSGGFDPGGFDWSESDDWDWDF